MNPPYDPRPYEIVEIRGHQITGRRNEKKVTRDAQKWKKLKEARPQVQRQNTKEDQGSSDSDVDIVLESLMGQPGQELNEGANSGEHHPPATIEDASTPEESNQSATQHDSIAVQPRRNPPRARERPPRYR